MQVLMMLVKWRGKKAGERGQTPRLHIYKGSNIKHKRKISPCSCQQCLYLHNRITVDFFVLLFIFCLVLVASVILKAFSRAIELSNVLSERESKKIKNDNIANRIMVTA